MDRIVLVDGYSIINRAFYGVPMLSDARGRHTNAVYGFFNILFHIIDELQPSHVAVAFDVKKPTFRHELYAQYKGTRKPMPAELTEQVPYVKQLLSAMDITTLEKAGLEADDILGTVSRRAQARGMECAILSGDRDLLQVATDKTKIYLPKTQGGKTEMFVYDAAGVKELYGVTPLEFIDMKALMGDSSDNIPGLPGVGEKTAGAIIREYHSIENAYENVDKITPNKAKNAFLEHYDLAVLSKKLATIELDADIETDIDGMKIGDIYTAQAYELVKDFNFKSMMGRFENTKAAVPAQKEIHLSECENKEQALALIGEACKSERAGAAVEYGDIIYGISLCTDDEKAAFIPASLFRGEGEIEEVINKLLSSHIAWTDAKSAMRLLRGDDRFADHDFDDTGLMAYLLNPLRSEAGYEEIAMDYCGISLPGRKELVTGKREGLLALIVPDEIKKCCSYNAYSAYMSAPVLKERLEAGGMLDLYENIELPTTSALFRMECRGVKVMRDELKRYGDRLSVRIGELEGIIYDKAGERFNINSPKQLGEILFEKLGLPGGKKTKSGYSTAAEVLEKLSGEAPIVRDILEYRQLTKLKSTYADGLAQFIGTDGRIHSRFNQTVTATGRISSADPNLQNIPVRLELGREIRKVFVPEEGCVFVDADYSQIELRVLAHLSGDENLIKAYRSASDIHAITASTVFGVPIDEVTPLMRRNAKAVNFGIVYGISAFGLSEDLSISRKEAEEYIKQYFKSYPGIKEYLDGQVKGAKENGYVTTLYGRRRPVPEIKDPNFMRRQFGERVAMNSPIQGSAADIMKIAMLKVEKALKEAGLFARIILQVHDELLIEAKASEVERVKDILVKNMRDSFELRVPLEIGLSTGSTWYETK
ncbi:MAG: DNA polymerase I [Lachnospiraceae bacterium]|nr:DNA polymerase I [Lachnospiraceae bacterium]